MEINATSPPPWKLYGDGIILLYKFSQNEIEQNPFINENYKNEYLGGFGAVMIVNYLQSNVGPYGELLFIPGRFRFGNIKRYHISKIYVSSIESVVNGIKNWAIPKELADFHFNSVSNRHHSIKVVKNDSVFFDIEYTVKGFSFPLSTTLLPFPLFQENEGKIFLTKFYGKGKGKLITIKSLNVDSGLFPNISIKKPIIAMRVDAFNICFPIPAIIDNT